jgi:hypothetical protein
METVAYHALPNSVPQAVREAHANLPPETIATIESTITRQLIELSVIEQYKRGDIYLSDAAQALGFYPDIEKTMEWLQAHDVYIGPSEEMREVSRQAVRELVARRKASLAANPG